MDGISITVEGLKELQDKLDELTQKQADRCIRVALKAGAEIEQAAITERAPIKVGEGGYLPTGALKNDIIIKMKTNANGVPYAVVEPGKLTKFAARLVEYGHKIVQGGKLRKGGKHIGEVPPHPFIRPAYESTRQEVATAICTTLATEVTKAANRKGKS